MKTAGIIAEYNPFHNGHRYQIEELRARTGADYVIIAMSGDFVQRGEPAIYDKYTRTRMALSAGADLVLELPAAFATSSAEDFAACGVALLDRLGVVDLLCFGSESGDPDTLNEIAGLLVREPEEFSQSLKKQLKSGASFPKAREYAVRQWMAQSGAQPGPGEEENTPAEGLLSSPNNILAIEYIKALRRRGSRMQPYTIKRCGKGYHDTGLTPGSSGLGLNMDFASASAIRKAIYEKNPQPAMEQMPIPPGDTAIPVFPDDLSPLLNYRLLELSRSGPNLTSFADVSCELADRISNQLLQFSSFTERIELLKTKQYTYTRISRALIHILLGITDSMIECCRRNDYAPYARILGFNRNALALLTEMKEKSGIPLITKTADAANILHADALELLRQDIYCSHVYQTVMQQKSGRLYPNEYTHPIVIL